MDQPDLAPPKAPILSYLSNISTPTRVRRLAAIGLAASSLFYWAGGGLLCWLLGTLVWGDAEYLAWSRGAGTPTLPDFIGAGKEHLLLTALAGVVLAGALLEVLLAKPVHRGSRTASIMGLAMLLPVFPVVILLAAAMTSFALQILLDPRRESFRPCLWLLALPAGVLLILLMKDLGACLLWIAHHPQADKPPVPFLPQSDPSLPSAASREFRS
jgi:hypothetical protein